MLLYPFLRDQSALFRPRLILANGHRHNPGKFSLSGARAGALGAAKNAEMRHRVSLKAEVDFKNVPRGVNTKARATGAFARVITNRHNMMPRSDEHQTAPRGQ